MRERAEAGQPAGDRRAIGGMGRIGHGDGERGGQRVRHVVVAEQRELGAIDERRVEQHEPVRIAVEPGAGGALQREAERLPGKLA